MRLVHPAGAEVTVPPAQLLYGEYLDVRRLDRPTDTPAWTFVGSAWKFVSTTGVVHDQPIRVRLPLGEGGSSAQVVLLMPSGAWQPLSTEREADALVGTVVGVPAPWVVAVAEPRQRDYPDQLRGTEGELASRELAEFERLALSDPAEWEMRARAWLAEHPAGEIDTTLGAGVPKFAARGVPPGDSASTAAAAPVFKEFSTFEADLATTLTRLQAARVYTTASGARILPAATANVAAFHEYRAGVAALLRLRDTWFEKRGQFAELFGKPRDYQAVLSAGGVPIEDVLESALATYAPWGIELTAALARSDVIAGMDLSVIYGEALFADIPLPTQGVPPEVLRSFPGPGWDGMPEGCYCLRLFSRAAIENWSLLDYLKDWRTEAFLRYLPVALWVLGIGTGGPGLLAVATADQVLNTWQAQYENQSDPVIYGQIQWATTSVVAAPLLFEASRDYLRAGFGLQGFSLADHQANLVSFIYSAAVSWAVTGSEWYLLKDVRAITAGTRGYCVGGRCNWLSADSIPPVQLVVSLRGPAAEDSPDRYPRTRIKTAAWNLAYNEAAIVAGTLDLHELFRSGNRESYAQLNPVPGKERIGPDVLEALAWNEYARNSWADAWIDTAPDVQAVRVEVPRSLLATYREHAGAKLGDPIRALNLLLRIETPEGHVLVPVEDIDEKRSAADRSNTYLLAAWSNRDDATADDLSPGFRGGSGGPLPHKVSLEPLRRRYTAYLYSSGQPEEDWVPVAIEFSLVPGPHTDADVGGAARVHETDAIARAEPPTRWVIREVDFTESGVFEDPYALFQRQYWTAIRPDVCRLDLLSLLSNGGHELSLSCVFVPGCPDVPADACFSWTLATDSPPPGGRASLAVRSDAISGSFCNSLTGEAWESCVMASYIDATLDGSGVLSGSFGYRWEMPRATGTWTVRFRADPVR